MAKLYNSEEVTLCLWAFLCFSFSLRFIFIYVGCVCVCVLMLHVFKCPQLPEEGIRYPGAELQAVLSFLTRECWELNSCPLEEQEVLLLTEPLLHPLGSTFLGI